MLSEINKKYPTCLFSLRGLDSEKSRFGLVECVNHGLLNAYPVLYEREGALVAQVKGTVLLMPSGASDRVTSAPLPALASEKGVEDDEIKALLSQSLKAKKKKKKEKGGAAAATTTEAAAVEAA